MSNTTHKNRFRHLLPNTLAEVDSLFEQFLGAAPSSVAASALGWRAPASFWEADDRLHLEIDAPGVAKDGVEVTFDKGTLSVSIERRPPEDRRFHHNERGFGKLTRTVALPETVDPDSIEASLNDGVLHVSIAKRPEAQPKRIELN